jgi:glutamate N-acetyltransferase/amino-acid N-acetyltransferase
VSVTAPKGFVAAGIAAGIKPSGNPDLSLVATDDGKPVAAAGVFTQNKATAAPVQVSRAHLEATSGRAAAVILNSGNANAATGASGKAHAETMCADTAAQLGCGPEEVLVCSTGLIGIPLPIDVITKGIPELCAARTADGGESAATAIMTTDTKRKETLVEGEGFTVGGMAKGAAMLAPNMATMLAVLTTDAEADPAFLQSALQRAVAASFNTMTVDGCTSTNDTVLILASGRAGKAAEADLADAIKYACIGLAEQMVADAEGATKVVRVRVVGAENEDQAAIAARKVAQSQLCKCSWYGKDPYWGRIVSELGTAGVDFDPDLVSVAYGGTVVCRDGVAADHDVDLLAEHMEGRVIEVTADLGLGRGEATVLTNDLTHGYIDENMTTS